LIPFPSDPDYALDSCSFGNQQTYNLPLLRDDIYVDFVGFSDENNSLEFPSRLFVSESYAGNTIGSVVVEKESDIPFHIGLAFAFALEWEAKMEEELER